MPARIGLLGGTFDPIHIGHLRVAEEAVEALDLDSFLFIPAATPPHKPDRRIESFADRRRMIDLAVKNHLRFLCCDIEQRLPGKSYTVVTLRALRREFPSGSEFFFLMGMDAFLELDTWYQFKDLFTLASIVVLRRPGYPSDKIGQFLERTISPDYSEVAGGCTFVHPVLHPVHFMDNTRLEISSSQIRRLAAEGRSVRYLVPDEIMSYISENKLYQKEDTVSAPREKKESKTHAD